MASMNYCSLMMSLCFLALLLGSAVSARSRGEEADQCQLERITAQEPNFRIQSEAGETQMWDWKCEDFRCAGLAAVRNIIEPRGLVLPSYSNFPLLAYIVRGSGMLGVLMPGCPETFQSPQEQDQEEGSYNTKFHDQHQKIRRFQEGDVVAISAGWTHWCYNDGNEDVEVIIVEDTSNNLNQLDQNPREFFIAGNPQQGFEGAEQRRERYHQTTTSVKQNAGNVFLGMDEEFLCHIFGIDRDTARKLRGEDDRRGRIVRVKEGLQVISPPLRKDERNGLEETLCSVKLIQNINSASRADVFNPRSGRITTLTGNDLPILNFVRLSALRGILYKNAIMTPHYNLDAHTALYTTKGDAKIQITDQSGKTLLNEVVRKGQMIVVPQNFVVAMQAGEQGFEWISFRTHSNAMIGTLAGQTSVMRGLPADVIAASYRVPRKEALRLKMNRDETMLFESRSTSQRLVGA